MKIKSRLVEHAQGSDEWMQHRAKSLNASELAAAMGISPYMTRTQLIGQKATGLVPEVNAATQRIFDSGHQYEAIARPWAEEIIGEELYQSVLAAEVEGLALSVSFDGQTMAGEINWEHKSLNETLRQSLDAGVIPDEYHPQMEQGLMLSGAEKCLFMASNGDRETMRFAWYTSSPELRAKIIPTWKQIQADVAVFVPGVKAAPVVATPVETLPSLNVKVDGTLAIASNLPYFGVALRNFIDKIPAQPSTDQEFAETYAACKALKRAEDALDAAESNALAQLADVDTMRRLVADFKALARATRLQREKLVEQRKESIKGEIVAGGVAALQKYIAELNATIGQPLMPTIQADFGGSIKGLRTVDSIQNAANTALARSKIEATGIADRIKANLATLAAHADKSALFPDVPSLALKQPDDLAAMITARISTHEANEAARKALEAQEQAAREAKDAQDRAWREAEQARQEVPESKPAETLDADIRDALAQVMGSTPALIQQPATLDVMHAIGNGIMYGQVVVSTIPKEETGEMVRLGEINARISPLSITADGLAQLGFLPATTEKSAKLYLESQIPAIYDELITVLRRAAYARVASAKTQNRSKA